MSLPVRILFGAITTSTIMAAIGITVQTIDKNGGFDDVAASVEASRQDWQETVLPDVEFSLADAMSDPAIEQMLQEREANGEEGAVRQVAMARIMDALRKPLMDQAVSAHCGPEALDGKSDEELARLSERCTGLIAFSQTITTPWALVGMTQDEWLDAMRNDRAAVQDAMTKGAVAHLGLHLPQFGSADTSTEPAE